MLRFIPVLLIACLTLASGALAGVLANRWGPRADMLGAGAGIAAVPHGFGDWRLDAETSLDDNEIEMLGCTGHFVRRYLNRAKGDVVDVVVMVGPPGRISVHTPEVCYTSAGYRQDGRRERVKVRLGDDRLSDRGVSDRGLSDEETAHFWRVPFVSESRDGAKLAVYYGWCDGGRWTAPERPRFAYGGRPYLYKIQLNAPLSPGRGGEERDVGRDFLESLVPALTQVGIPARKVSGE